LIKEICFVFIIGKVDAFQVHNFIIFFRFVQNHCQSGADSAKTLLNQPNGFGLKMLEYFEEFAFRFFRYRYFNHSIFL